MSTPGGLSWLGGWDEPGIQQLVIVQTGTPNSGVFVYTGTPAAGNPPVFNITPPGTTTDPYGNTIVANSYTGTGGAIVFNTTVPEIDINNAAGTLIGQIKGLLTSPTGLILQGSGSASLQTATGTSKIFVGTAVGPNVITLTGPVSDINAGVPGSAGTLETWHAMSPLLNSWAAQAAPNVQPQYRKVASPPNSVEVIGSLDAAAATTTRFFTLPAGYLPASQQPVPAGTFSGSVAIDNVAFGFCDTSGNLTIQQRTASETGIYFHGFISLDA